MCFCVAANRVRAFRTGFMPDGILRHVKVIADTFRANTGNDCGVNKVIYSAGRWEKQV